MVILLRIPENLDLDAVIQQFPINHLSGVKKDYLAYILHVIIMEEAFTDPKVLKENKGFVPLSAAILQSIIPQYKECLKYLKGVGIIQSDNHYIRGEKSIGYKFTDPYDGIPYQKIPVEGVGFHNKLKRGHKGFSGGKDNQGNRGKSYPYLKKWFNPERLKISTSGAMQWINDYYAMQLAKINAAQSSEKRKDQDKKNLNKARNSYRVIIEEFSAGNFNCLTDTSGCRFHSLLTRLKRELRQFITYDGKPLVAVDISCSQPYFSQMILKKEFWISTKSGKGKSTLKEFHEELYKELRENIKEYATTIMLLDSSKTLYSRRIDVDKFCKLVADGMFYEYMHIYFSANKIHLPPGNNEARKRVKELTITTLYDDGNKSYNRLSNSPFGLFRAKFPTVVQVFDFVKSKRYADLAILLQRIESYAILEVTCKRISKERPDLPIFTIHDSIATIEGEEAYVQSIMEEELNRISGCIPKLKTEYWADKA